MNCTCIQPPALFLVMWRQGAKGLLLAQKRCRNGRPLAEKPQPASTRITAWIRHVTVCVCVRVCSHCSCAACYCCSCPSAWRLKNLFTVIVLFLLCSCYSTFRTLIFFFFLTHGCFCRFVFVQVAAVFSHLGTIYLTWHARWSVSQMLPSGEGPTGNNNEKKRKRKRKSWISTII